MNTSPDSGKPLSANKPIRGKIWNASADEIRGLTDEVFQQVYNKLEDGNYHTENVLLTAKRKGTPEDIAEAEAILKAQNKAGSLTDDLRKRRDGLNIKLSGVNISPRENLEPETPVPGFGTPGWTPKIGDTVWYEREEGEFLSGTYDGILPQDNTSSTVLVSIGGMAPKAVIVPNDNIFKERPSTGDKGKFGTPGWTPNSGDTVWFQEIASGEWKSGNFRGLTPDPRGGGNLAVVVHDGGRQTAFPPDMLFREAPASAPATEPTPGPAPEPASDEEPDAVSILKDILAGNYDNAGPSKVDELLDEAAGEIEDLGLMEQYEGLLNRAADYLTELLEREAA